MALSNQDFQLVKGFIDKYTADFGKVYGFNEKSIGFQFLVMEKMFNLQEDEIIEAITDTIFQGILGNNRDPDRGIDAFIIDEEKKEVHLFNFKYTDKDFNDIKGREFDSGEVDKILGFVSDLYQKNADNFSEHKANKSIKDKVNELWSLIDDGVMFKYKIHLTANIFKGLPVSESERMSESLKEYKGEVVYDNILIEDIVDLLNQRSEKIDSRFRALNTNFFDKTDSGRRALIIEMSGIDMLRIVSDSAEVRNNCDCSNKDILSSSINEDVFSDNVRLSLKDRTTINRNITATALDEGERSKIFFYNNGITITCDKIDYQGFRNPIISLRDIQIVNGGQTMHALRSAFEKNQDGFEKISVLCKIFETNDSDFKTKVAEYTNSQNPVSNRDIRSIDSIQIKLEKDLASQGYMYARKKFQHEETKKDKRIDAEKLGQALMAFELELPGESKNRKSLIFGEKYALIFNDNLTAKKALAAFTLYKDIESKKLANKTEKPYLLHATYYIMFFTKKIAESVVNHDYISHYDEALTKIEYIIEKEKTKLKDDYSDAVLFKSNRPKEYLAELDL